MKLIYQLLQSNGTTHRVRRVIERLLVIHRKATVLTFACDGCIDPP